MNESPPDIADSKIVESVLAKLATGKTYAEVIGTEDRDLTKQAIIAALTHANGILKAKEKKARPTGLTRLLIKKNILDRQDQQITLLGHVLLTGSLFSLVIVSYLIMWCIGTVWEKQWINSPTEKDELVIKAQLQENKFFAATEIDRKNRLIQQLDTINDLAKRHCRIMSFFYKQYYISLSIGGGAAFVALFCVLFISKEGWKTTNNALINLGTTSFGISLVFLTNSQIFQQAENLNTSQALYTSDLVLRDEFLSSLHTNQLLVESKVKNNDLSNIHDRLIQHTDSRLKELHLIRLGFDPTPILGIKNRVGTIIGVPDNPSPSPTKSSVPLPSPTKSAPASSPS
jgi:hypothetical protein